MAKSCEQTVEFEVPSDVAKQAFEEAAKKVKKQVAIKGFRKGKVPIEMVKSLFKSKIIEQMLRDLLPKVSQQEIEKRGIDAIDVPVVEDVKLDDDLTIKVKLRVYIWPKIKLPNYKKMRVKKKKIEVTEDEINKALESYYKSLSGAKAEAEGDINSEEKPKKDVPEFTEEQLKKLGFDSIEQLKEDIRKKLLKNKEYQAKQDIDKEIREFLLKHSKLDVPDKWVEKQFEQKLRSFASTLKQMGMSTEQITKILQERKDDIYKSAEEDVKMFFIIEEIGRKESIEASEEEIDVRLEKMAERYGIDKDKMKKYIESRTGWDNFCLDIDHEKVWNFLVDLATNK